MIPARDLGGPPEQARSARHDRAAWAVVGLSALAAAAMAAAVVASDSASRWMCLLLSALLCVAAGLAGYWVGQARQLQAALGDAQARLARDDARWRDIDLIVPAARFEWLCDGDRWWGERALYRMLGLPPHTLPSSAGLLQRFVHPDDMDRVQDQLRQALAGSAAFDCRCRLVRDDGQVRHVHARGQVVRAHPSGPARLVGVVVDQTDAVRSADDLRAAQRLLDAIDQPASVVDAEMNFRLTNKAWHAVTGVSPRHQGGIRFEHVFPVVTSPARRKAFARCAHEGIEQVVTGPNPAAPHSGRHFETRYLPFNDPAASWRGVMMVSREVVSGPHHQAPDAPIDG